MTSQELNLRSLYRAHVTAFRWRRPEQWLPLNAVSMIEVAIHFTMKKMSTTPWDAVIFDYGGVLSYAPFRRELAESATRIGLDEPSFFKVYSNTRDYYGRSPEEYKQHWLRVAEAAGVEMSVAAVEDFIALESDLWTRPNAEVLALAREIKASGLKTAILSNMTVELLGRLREKLDWLGEFDVQIWSCEAGKAKPDASIYRACLAELDCEPARALFFDDRPCNVDGAKRVGIDGHIFESVQQARSIVERGPSLR
jgi:putative hydrolase of the HAD superfamily